MRMPAFEFSAPVSLAQALELLAQSGSRARVLAGGTDLLPALKHGGAKPERVVSLGGIQELEGIGFQEREVRIGALTKIADLADHPRVRENLPLLAQAAGLIGSWQIRNVATLGGNLANGSPAADTAGPLLALGASVVVADSKGGEEIPLSRFFQGPGKTALQSGRVLKEVVIPLPQDLSFGCYLKLMRKKAVDLALIGVAVQLRTDPDTGRIAEAALALGGVAPTPIRAARAEQKLVGLEPAQVLEAAPKIAALAQEATDPISDVRASAEYRRAMVGVFVRRGLTQVLTQALEGSAHKEGGK